MVEKQYKTAEEMLAALTDQKLKLAMEVIQFSFILSFPSLL